MIAEPSFSDLLFSNAVFLPLTVILGLIFGSFATALSYRLPRDISIVSKARSSCPSCNHDLSFIDLVPVFSWLFLRGRCRFCKAPIGWRYPLIELATLALCLLFYWRFGPSPFTLFLLPLAPVITSIIDIDLHYKIIPDGLNLSILGLGFAALFAAMFLGGLRPDDALALGLQAAGGASLYGFGSVVLRQGVMLALKKEPLGWGDVKFFAVAGFWLGLNPDSLAYFMFVSGVSGILLALIWRKVKQEREFPFGPGIIAAFVVMLLWQGPCFWPLQ